MKTPRKHDSLVLSLVTARNLVLNGSGNGVVSLIRLSSATESDSHRQLYRLSTTRSPHFLEVIQTFEVVLDFKVAFDSILLKGGHHVADGQTGQIRGFSKRSLSVLVLLDGKQDSASVNEVANRF